MKYSVKEYQADFDSMTIEEKATLIAFVDVKLAIETMDAWETILLARKMLDTQRIVTISQSTK